MADTVLRGKVIALREQRGQLDAHNDYSDLGCLVRVLCPDDEEARTVASFADMLPFLFPPQADDDEPKRIGDFPRFVPMRESH